MAPIIYRLFSAYYRVLVAKFPPPGYAQGMNMNIGRALLVAAMVGGLASPSRSLSTSQERGCRKARFDLKTCHYGSIILAVGSSKNAEWRQGVAALAAAMTETNGPYQRFPAKITNPSGGDASSVGIFQILNIHGSYAQRINPWWASDWWFKQLREQPDARRAKTPAAIAQAVEDSAYPSRYRAQVGDAVVLAYALGYRDVGGRLHLSAK